MSRCKSAAKVCGSPARKRIRRLLHRRPLLRARRSTRSGGSGRAWSSSARAPVSAPTKRRRAARRIRRSGVTSCSGSDARAVCLLAARRMRGRQVPGRHRRGAPRGDRREPAVGHAVECGDVADGHAAARRARVSGDVQRAGTIYGRTFDQNGVPSATVAAAGTNAFAFSSTLTTTLSTAAIAGSGQNILAFWDSYDTTGTGHGVACRALDPSGNLTAGQLSVLTDAADTGAATQLSNNNIAVTWQVSSPSYAIHSVIVKPDCTALSNVVGISATVGADGLSPHRAHVAGTGNFVLYAWIQDGDVHVRTSTLSGSVFGNDITLIPKTATMDVEALRVFPMGGEAE